MIYFRNRNYRDKETGEWGREEEDAVLAQFGKTNFWNLGILDCLFHSRQ